MNNLLKKLKLNLSAMEEEKALAKAIEAKLDASLRTRWEKTLENRHGVSKKKSCSDKSRARPKIK